MRARALLSFAFVISGASAHIAWAQDSTGYRPLPPNALQGGFSPSARQPTTAEPERPQQGEPASSVDPWSSFAPVSPGVTVANVTFLPSVTAGAFFDDNVYATHSSRQGSWGEIVHPELGLRAAGQNYAVEARGFIEQRWYNRFSTEDTLDGAGAVAATLMPDPDTQIVLKGGYARAHEARGTGEYSINGTAVFLGFDRPLGFDTYSASAALNKRFNRW